MTFEATFIIRFICAVKVDYIHIDISHRHSTSMSNKKNTSVIILPAKVTSQNENTLKNKIDLPKSAVNFSKLLFNLMPTQNMEATGEEKCIRCFLLNFCSLAHDCWLKTQNCR